MFRKKAVYGICLALLFFLLLFVCSYVYNAATVINAYGAKMVCAAVYLQHRTIDDVVEEELSIFPFSLANYTLHEQDSSVTGTIAGLAMRTAIFRNGIGTTIVSDSCETQIRTQHFSLPSKPLIPTEDVRWPDGDQLPDTLPFEIDQVKLDRVLQQVFHKNKKERSLNTHAVVVVYHGQLIAEKYAAGYDKNSVLPGWSVAKSITSALTGILVKQGKLDVNAPAPVPEWKDTDKEKITLKQLLQQTTGLDYQEYYRRPSTATEMLFRRGNAAAYATQLPLAFVPGTVFNYSSGNSNIISRIIREATGEGYHAFPYESLFYKTGMYSVVLEPDASGTYVGSSFIYATARDYARFGLLYYNNGKWNNEQILPEEWVKATVRPSVADTLQHYGYQFWLNGFDKNTPSKRWYPDVPHDMYFADGFGGQDIYIIPSKKLVVVRLGAHVIDENELLKGIISSIR